MTDSSKILIGLVVDRSGSMSACQQEMEDGIDTFLTKQKDRKGQAKATLAQFDTIYEVVYPPTAIEDVPKYHLIPRYGTALHDAMARFIIDVGADLAKQKEKNRPGKVIIVVVTDGMENASTEYGGFTGRQRIKEMIVRQQSEYQWEFVFLGANMDAVREAGHFGIAPRSAMTYTVNNSASVMGSSLDSYVACASAGPAGSANFSDDERKAAVQP